MTPSRGDVLRRLWSFTSTACSDPVFRRELRYSSHSAWARFDFAWEEHIPRELPIRHYEVSVNFEEALLFGLPGAPGRVSSHWLEKTQARLLRTGAKPLLLEHGREDEMAALASQLRVAGMAALLSPYEFTPLTEDSKGGYSNLAGAQRPAVPGSGRWRSLVAGRETDRVELAWLCLLFGWDEFLGRLLGYPECCAASFARIWPEARSTHQGDVAELLLQRSASAWAGRFGWETNVFGRYHGIEAIQHFPCDWSCSNTVQLARRNRRVLESYGVDSEMFRILSAPVLFSSGYGVVLFPGAVTQEQSEEVILSFEPSSLIASDRDGTLAQQLTASGGRLVVRGKEIVAGDNLIQGWLMDFSGLSGENHTPSSLPALNQA